MNTNGRHDVDKAPRMQHLLHGARGVGWVVPLLTDAARALDTAGDALAQIADDLSTISADTARALSDTTEMKRHLRAITEREQVLRREVDALKAQLRHRPQSEPAAKKPAGKKRTRRRTR